MEWLKRTRSGEDLAGLCGAPPRKDISLEEFKCHKSPDDAWTVLRGKVYQLSAYTPYHPGGDVMLKAAGKDGTALFDKFHPWVNVEALMSKCLVGHLLSIPSTIKEEDETV
jgi:cytochrome-b5 reductase